MSSWIIKYWDEKSDKSSIEKWLKNLDKEQFKYVTKKLDMLLLFGNTLQLPHSKALGKGLFELRDQKYGYRIYYGFNGKFLIILLAAGDKTTQDKDIKIARDRLLKI